MAFLELSIVDGRRWVGPSRSGTLPPKLWRSHRACLALCAGSGARGVAAEEPKAFLAPLCGTCCPIRDHCETWNRRRRGFLQAVKDRQRIAIFADYDVDGGSSAALAAVWLRDMGARDTLYSRPHRRRLRPQRRSHGSAGARPRPDHLRRLRHAFARPDCAAKGADVIVLDHHLGGETLPDALAVVNPNRQDEDGDLGISAPPAWCFLMLVEAGRQCADGAQGPDLMALLDLGRAWPRWRCRPADRREPRLCRQGLRLWRGANAPDWSRWRMCTDGTRPDAYHLGFLAGPRGQRRRAHRQADLGRACWPRRSARGRRPGRTLGCAEHGTARH